MAGQHMRYVLPLALAVVIAVGAVGAASAGGQGSMAQAGVLRVNISESDVQYLDPQLDYEFYGWTLLFATCVNLMSYPDKGGSRREPARAGSGHGASPP